MLCGLYSTSTCVVCENGFLSTQRHAGLVAHEDANYTEWGASASVRLDPGAAGTGLSFTLAPSFGVAASGVERLWSLDDATGLATHDTFDPAGRLTAELGYGLAAFDGRGAMTPFAALALSDTDGTWRTGARWTLGQDLALNLEGIRREAVGDNGSDHAIGVELSARW